LLLTFAFPPTARKLRELAGKIGATKGAEELQLTEPETRLLMDALYETRYSEWGTHQARGANAVRSQMAGPWERGEVRTIRLKEGKGEVHFTAPIPPQGCGFSLRFSPPQRLGFSQELLALAEKRLDAESQRLLQNEKPRFREKPKRDLERD
jgi:hypothetical protein